MKRTIFTGAFLFLFTATQALAFCTWGFVPQEREYQPLDATEVFISYEDGVQTLVLKPEWQGNAKEFGIVYPTPGKPEVTEGPTDLFWQLEEATNPFVVPNIMLDDSDMIMMAGAESVEEKTVTVVEEKQVGEYAVTVLTATDADDLVEWLEDNDYNYSKDDADKVAYYVEQTGFYFVALKVDAEHFDEFPRPMPVEVDGGIGDGAVPLDELIAAESTEIDTEEEESVVEDIAVSKLSIAPGEWFWGELSPIQISFETDRVQLPMRTLKSDMPQMTFDMYTLSDQPLYVPGVDTVWSNLVDSTFLKKVPSLNDYAPKAKWLMRQEVRFNPSQSDEDLYLTEATTNKFMTIDPGSQVRFNPSELDTDTGIIAGTRGKVVRTDGEGNAFTFTRSLTLGAVGSDVLELQKLLNAEGFTISESGAGAPGSETTYFGNRTKQALIKYQNFYRADILTPVNLTSGTGYFGPSTIGFVNR
jgi:hypothetical protein